MAINPELITTIRVDQLAPDAITLTSLLPHQVGTDLKQATIQELVDLVATQIGVSGGVGYLPISVTDGQQLPDVPENPSFFLCGIGTFLNINGFPNVVTTEPLNAIMSLTDHWELAVEIPITAEVGVQTVTGSAVDNTDPLNPVINFTNDGVQTIVAGTNITVDNTDPLNPIVSADGGAVDSVNGQTGVVALGLQEVVEEGRTFAETVGDITYDFEVFNSGVFLVKTTNNITGDVTTFKNSENESSIEYYSITNDSYSGIAVSDGYAQIITEKISTGKSSSIIFQEPISISTYVCPSVSENGNYILDLEPIEKTSNFTSQNGKKYSTNGTLTVTDPTPVANKGYIVHVIGGTSTIGGVGYTAGALVYRFYNGSSWVSTNMNAGGAVWGGITGTLSDQTDLNSALSGKEPTITTLPISKGGTNSGTALSNNRIMRSNGGAITEAPAITTSRALKSDANGIPTHFDTATEPSLAELALIKGTTDWIDISNTSTIVGWSSFTNRVIQYKIIGNIMYVQYFIEGTSNATATSFTLPNNSALNLYTTIGYSMSNSGVSSTQIGRLIITASSNVVNLTRDPTGVVFSNVGVKTVVGEFFIKI